MYFFPLQSVAQSPEIRATLAGAKPESFVLTADQCSENNKLSNARCFTIVRIGILLPKLFWPTVRKNCSSDREKLLKLEAEGREFAKILRSLEQFIQTVKGQNNFW